MWRLAEEDQARDYRAATNCVRPPRSTTWPQDGMRRISSRDRIACRSFAAVLRFNGADAGEAGRRVKYTGRTLDRRRVTGAQLPEKGC